MDPLIAVPEQLSEEEQNWHPEKDRGLVFGKKQNERWQCVMGVSRLSPSLSVMSREREKFPSQHGLLGNWRLQ
jgi:hypothetical protein